MKSVGGFNNVVGGRVTVGRAESSAEPAANPRRETNHVHVMIVDENPRQWLSLVTEAALPIRLVNTPEQLQEALADRWDIVLIASALGSTSRLQLAQSVQEVEKTLTVVLLGQRSCLDVPSWHKFVSNLFSRPAPAPSNPDASDAAANALAPVMPVRPTLSVSQRQIEGLKTPPFTQGELNLLRFLGTHPWRWYTSYELAQHAYSRSDASARQLVWKSASTLRRKLRKVEVAWLESCRRRGYRVTQPMSVCE